MIAAIVARLSGIAGTPFRRVSGAPDFAVAAENRPAALPAAYVLLLSEAAGENECEDAVVQTVRAEFGIVLAVSNVADARGRAALSDLSALRAAVGPALLGWSPLAACTGCEFTGGAVLGLKDGVLWWQDVYATRFLIESV